MKTTQELIDLISLYKLDDNLFEGKSEYIGSPNVFGGQIVSQALYAAYQTVSSDRFCHSLHSYFILKGDLCKKIHYSVIHLRDGGNFSSRMVMAKQSNETIFIMNCSFQKKQNGYEYQEKIPFVKHPDELISWVEIAENYGDYLPNETKKFMLTDRPINFKPVETLNLSKKKINNNYSNVWINFNDVPNNLSLATIQQLIAYSSDYNLLLVALKPHEPKANYGNTQIASLDHSIWFHREPNLQDWILVSVNCPSTGGTRGFTNGRLFNISGELICSIAQEGLIRPK